MIHYYLSYVIYKKYFAWVHDIATVNKKFLFFITVILLISKLYVYSYNPFTNEEKFDKICYGIFENGVVFNGTEIGFRDEKFPEGRTHFKVTMDAGNLETLRLSVEYKNEEGLYVAYGKKDGLIFQWERDNRGFRFMVSLYDANCQVKILSI